MNICIVKLSAMGDIIHAMVVLEFINKNIPDAKVDWVVESGFKDILKDNPYINKILPISLKSIKKDKKNFFEQYKLLKSYSKNDYDLIIDAQGLIKSAIVSKIIGAKKIVGFDKNSIREPIASMFYDTKVTIGYEKNAIDRNLKVILSPLNINYTKDDILNKDIFLYSKDANTPEDKDYIVFVVGASKANKIYPKEKFLSLANMIKEKIIVVWGNQDEYEVAKFLENNCNYIKVAQKGNLNDLKRTISKAKMVIGADTGPTHIAWGVNVPSITIFGNTPEYRNTYLTDINKVIKSDSKVDALKLDYNDFSIKDIDEKDIKKLYDELVGKKSKSTLL